MTPDRPFWLVQSTVLAPATASLGRMWDEVYGLGRCAHSRFPLRLFSVAYSSCRCQAPPSALGLAGPRGPFNPLAPCRRRCRRKLFALSGKRADGSWEPPSAASFCFSQPRLRGSNRIARNRPSERGGRSLRPPAAQVGMEAAQLAQSHGSGSVTQRTRQIRAAGGNDMKPGRPRLRRTMLPAARWHIATHMPRHQWRP